MASRRHAPVAAAPSARRSRYARAGRARLACAPMAHPRRFRFGIQLATALAARADVGRARPQGRGPRLLHAVHARPLRRPARAGARADGRRRRHHHACGSAPLVFDNDYKHPVVLAKELATLDVLSGGRLEVGLGAGWMTSDYDQSGIPMDAPAVRVDRLEEGIAVLKGLLRRGPLRLRRASTTRSPGSTACPSRSSSPIRRSSSAAAAKRVLSIAAREADIVGINPSIRSGAGRRRGRPADGVAERTDQKLGWVQGGGRRPLRRPRDQPAEVRLRRHRRPQGHARDDGAAVRARPGRARASTRTPGSARVDQICEDLAAGRERWDASYIVVQGVDAMEAVAPIVARLAGT